MEGLMGSLRSPEPDISMLETDASSSASLIERGLNCIQKGRYVEGVAYLSLAREQLFPNQVQLITTIDALNKATESYLLAQQALHETSKRFALSDIEQQAQIAALKKLLSTLVEDVDSVSHARARSQKHSESRQSLQLIRLPQASAENTKEDQLSSLSEDGNALPSLYVTCFGHFEVRRSGLSNKLINLCQNLKGQAILRYLVAQPKHRERVDALMALLWPEEEPEVAQHKLRVAISALRCSLNKDVVSEAGGGYILYKGQVYQLNPSVVLQSDMDEFLAFYQAGQRASHRAEAVAHYEKACHLYTGPFLAEDLYTDWSFIEREELSKTYIAMCGELAEFNLENGSYKDAVQWASAILKVDRCDEEAYQQLIRAYAAQGHRSEALRQYQQCQKVLREELGVQPTPETQKLFYMLFNGTDGPAVKRK